MLERFLAKFQVDGAGSENQKPDPASIDKIVLVLQGLSFNDGLYRVYSTLDRVKWTSITIDVFRQYAGRVECFGSDWLGRQFAIELYRSEKRASQVLMFEVGKGKVYQIPGDLADFHNKVLVDLPEPTLEAQLYEDWRVAGNPAPSISQCAGYKVPPILGGQDEISNLVTIDMEVEWHITSQLLEVTSRLPERSRLDKMALDE